MSSRPLPLLYPFLNRGNPNRGDTLLDETEKGAKAATPPIAGRQSITFVPYG